jgi:hypothetical protein
MEVVHRQKITQNWQHEVEHDIMVVSSFEKIDVLQ